MGLSRFYVYIGHNKIGFDGIKMLAKVKWPNLIELNICNILL